MWWSYMKGSSLLQIDLQTAWYPANLAPDYLAITCTGILGGNEKEAQMIVPSMLDGTIAAPLSRDDVETAIGTVSVRHGRGYLEGIVSPDKCVCSLDTFPRYFFEGRYRAASNVDQGMTVSLSIVVDLMLDNEGPSPPNSEDNLFQSGFVVPVNTCDGDLILDVGAEDFGSDLEYIFAEADTVGMRELASVGRQFPIIDDSGLFVWDVTGILLEECGKIAAINAISKERSVGNDQVEGTASADFLVWFPPEPSTYSVTFQNLADSSSPGEGIPSFSHPEGPMIAVYISVEEYNPDIVLTGTVPTVFSATLLGASRPLPLAMESVVRNVETPATILMESQCSPGIFQASVIITLSGSACGCEREIVVEWQCAQSLAPPLCFSDQVSAPIILDDGASLAKAGEFYVLAGDEYNSTLFNYELEISPDSTGELVVSPPIGELRMQALQEFSIRCIVDDDEDEEGEGEGRLLSFVYKTYYVFEGDRLDTGFCSFQVQCLRRTCQLNQNIFSAVLGEVVQHIASVSIVPEGGEVPFSLSPDGETDINSVLRLNVVPGTNAWNVEAECLGVSSDPIVFGYESVSSDGLQLDCGEISFVCEPRSCMRSQLVDTAKIGEGLVDIGGFDISADQPELDFLYELLISEDTRSRISVLPISGEWHSQFPAITVTVECLDIADSVEFEYRMASTDGQTTFCVKSFIFSCYSDIADPLDCPSLCPGDKLPLCHHATDGSGEVDYICVPLEYSDRIAELRLAGDFGPGESDFYDCFCNPINPAPTPMPSQTPTQVPTAVPSPIPTKAPTPVLTTMPTPPQTPFPFLRNPPAATPPPAAPTTAPPTPEPACEEMPSNLGVYCRVDYNGNVEYVIDTSPEKRNSRYIYFELQSTYSHNGLSEIYYDCWCQPGCPGSQSYNEIPTMVDGKSMYADDSVNFCIAVPARFSHCSFEFQHDQTFEAFDRLSYKAQVPGTNCTSEMIESNEVVDGCAHWTLEDYWGSCYQTYCTKMPWQKLYQYYEPHDNSQQMAFYGLIRSTCEVAEPDYLRGVMAEKSVSTNFFWSLSFPNVVQVNADEVRVYSEIVKYSSVIHYALIVDGFGWGFEDALVRGEIVVETSVQWPYRLTAVISSSGRNDTEMELRTKEDCIDIGATIPNDAAYIASRELSLQLYGIDLPEPCIQQWFLTVVPGSERCDITDEYKIDFVASCQQTLNDENTCPLAQQEEVYSQFQIFSEDFCDVTETSIDATGSLSVHSDKTASCDSQDNDFNIDWFPKAGTESDPEEEMQEYVQHFAYFQAILESEQAEIIATELQTVTIEVKCENPSRPDANWCGRVGDGECAVGQTCMDIPDSCDPSLDHSCIGICVVDDLVECTADIDCPNTGSCITIPGCDDCPSICTQIPNTEFRSSTWHLFVTQQGGIQDVPDLEFGWEDYPDDIDSCWEGDQYTTTKFWFNLPYSIFPVADDSFCTFETTAEVTIFFLNVQREDNKQAMSPRNSQTVLLEKRFVPVLFDTEDRTDLVGNSGAVPAVELKAPDCTVRFSFSNNTENESESPEEDAETMANDDVLVSAAVRVLSGWAIWLVILFCTVL